MKIKKPHNFIPYKKFPDKYFDVETNEEFPYEEINEHPRWFKFEYNNIGQIIYYEDNDGYWYKSEYNNNGNEIYYETSDGYWEKFEYNNIGQIIYYEDNDGYWYKSEYNNNGNEIYYENSYGKIIDKRI